MQAGRSLISVSLFGPRLRALRKKAGMTQQAVADRMRIHRTTYTKYETGVVTPDQQGLVSLAELFGVTVDFLLGREEPQTVLVLEDKDDAPITLTLPEKLLLQTFRQLDAEQRDELVRHARQVLMDQRNRK
ncbi:MAG: helix-turn-helix transcriptional regulator [Clostridia bacterium]|nr:helix-turn-helix transcriptional regulator [Clostridia bacterium]